MARFTPAPVAVFLSLLFLFTLSRAFRTPFPEPKPKSDSEPVTEPNKPKPHSHDTVSFTIDTIDPVPLTFLRFRPINRHFQPGRPLPLNLPSSIRTGHRRCRNGHRREIPYGNDAIVFSDAARQIHHQRWDRARGAVALPRLPATMVEHRDFDHHDFDHEHHHHHHHRHRDHHHGEESWLAKKIRKFFDLF